MPAVASRVHCPLGGKAHAFFIRFVEGRIDVSCRGVVGRAQRLARGGQRTRAVVQCAAGHRIRDSDCRPKRGVLGLLGMRAPDVLLLRGGHAVPE